jgi:hypothetical protein
MNIELKTPYIEEIKIKYDYKKLVRLVLDHLIKNEVSTD